jgi:hypothetical protein
MRSAVKLQQPRAELVHPAEVDLRLALGWIIAEVSCCSDAVRMIAPMSSPRPDRKQGTSDGP